MTIANLFLTFVAVGGIVFNANAAIAAGDLTKQDPITLW